MEVHSTEESKTKEAKPSRFRKGGFRTVPFILINESFEKVASYGLLPNMILYLLSDYHMSFAKGTNVIFMWQAATNFLSIAGAYIADSSLGRFLTIFLGSLFSLMGMIVLWLTTMIHDAKPPPCDIRVPESCKSPTSIQTTLLFSAFGLMSIGAGGIRPCSVAFGTDQIDTADNPNRQRLLESFFGWYFTTAIGGVMIALTAIVYIQDHHGWRIGFGVPAILMFFSTFFFGIAYPLYNKMEVRKNSLFTSLCQVVAVTWKNRKLKLPDSGDISWYYKNGATVTKPTDNLRWLNKACILKEPLSVTNAIDMDPWTICTVEQVEELKILIRVIPIWSSCIMLTVNMSQTLPVLQAQTMDRHILPNLQIPPGSFSFFSIAALVVWVSLYDRVIIPLLSKIKGKPVYISTKTRMGAGLMCSVFAVVVSGIVEHVRKKKAIEAGFLNNPQGVIKMSATWLILPQVLTGIAEALNLISQNEFFYIEFPKSMASIALALYTLGAGIASLLASLLLSTVDNLTKGDGKESWVSTNINKGQYEKYCWLLAIMSGVNFLYFVVCSWGYGPAKVVGGTISDSGDAQESKRPGFIH